MLYKTSFRSYVIHYTTVWHDLFLFKCNEHGWNKIIEAISLVLCESDIHFSVRLSLRCAQGYKQGICNAQNYLLNLQNSIEIHFLPRVFKLSRAISLLVNRAFSFVCLPAYSILKSSPGGDAEGRGGITANNINYWFQFNRPIFMRMRVYLRFFFWWRKSYGHQI